VNQTLVATELTLSRDRKVTPYATFQPNYGRWVPGIRNSFGLPAGKANSCPGETAWCRDICYAKNSERSAGVGDALRRNLEVLVAAGSPERMAGLLVRMLGRFARVADRRHLSPEERVFRIHWSGDFFSVAYAQAWAVATAAFPEITFWAYTRSLRPPVNVVPTLAGLPNLNLYLSTDIGNAAEAQEMAGRYPSVHLALCADDFRQAKELSAEPSVICPESSGRLALMTNGVGACVTCGLCVFGRADVRFKASSPSDHRKALPLIAPGPTRRDTAQPDPLVCPDCNGAKSRASAEVCRSCANERQKRRVTIHCPCGATREIPRSLYNRKAKVHYCSLSCRARFVNLAKPRAAKCRRGHHLTPENTIVLRSGVRRCRTCNNLRKLWHDHGGSLAKAIAWAKWVCGPEAPDLTDDEWEKVLRHEVLGAPKIVRSVILVPECTLAELVSRHKACGVDSLGRPVAASEAWL
jgi:hypothetical protein